jgi:hypothetical protein
MNLFFKIFFRSIYLLLVCLLVFAVAYCRGVTAIRAWVEQGGERPKSIRLTEVSTGRHIEITRPDLIAEFSWEIQHPHDSRNLKRQRTNGYYDGKAYFGPFKSSSFDLCLFSITRAGFFTYPRKFDPTADWGARLIARSEEATALELWSEFKKDERENK